jgi:hypothetical protein
MGRPTLWLALLALVAGLGAAIALAGAGPLPANGVSVYYEGPGGAWAREDEKWKPLDPCCNPLSLYVLEPTFVRGPALVSTNGAYYCLAPNEMVRLAWNPATGAWSLSGWCGCGMGDGLIYGGGGDNNFPPTDRPWLPDVPEVSGFDPGDVPPQNPVREASLGG